MDSDDWFDTAQFSRLISFLQDCDTDMVLLDRTKHYAQENRDEIVEMKNMEPDKVYDANTYDWLHCGNGPNITYAHNTVYKTSMMQKYLPVFCEHVLYDDVILQVMPIMVAESFVYTKLNVYHYLIGRPGQSFDPAIREEKANDVTTVLKQVMEFISKYRNLPPEGSTRKAWTEAHYSAFPTHHYKEISAFPYTVSQDRLSDWDVFIRKYYPDIKPNTIVRHYRTWPFPIFFCWSRNKMFTDRIKHHFNRVFK